MVVPSSNNGSRITGTSLPGSNMYKDTEPNCVIMLESFLIISFLLQERQIIIFLQIPDSTFRGNYPHIRGGGLGWGLPPKGTQGQFGGRKCSQNLFADKAKHLWRWWDLMFDWTICKGDPERWWSVCAHSQDTVGESSLETIMTE